MEFEEDATLDTSQVSDERGRSGRLSGLPGGGVAVGGGMGVIGLVVYLLISLTGGGATNLSADNGSGIDEVESRCHTGADANARTDCRVVGVVNSVQAFWSEEFAARGDTYESAKDAHLQRSSRHRLRGRNV